MRWIISKIIIRAWGYVGLPLIGLFFLLSAAPAFAAISIPFTVNLSEAVNVDTTGGTPRIAVNVGGVTRYATYTAGTGTSALTFTYDAVIGDVDLDGVILSSPIDLNGGTVKDLNGNDATLTFTVPNTSNVRVNYPSLGMDFVADADGRYTLNGTAYNDLPSFFTATGGTFTRASIGTYFDSAGTLQTASTNQPRFDYDPVTLQPKGILIEESRTNILQRSSEYNFWSLIGGATFISSNTEISPDGSMTADVFSTNSGASSQIYYSIGALPSLTSYSMSVWAKTSTGTKNFRVKIYDGVVDNFSPNFTATTSWQRFNYTATTSAGSGSGNIGITNSTPGVAGNLIVWGAQLEQGPFATSYIPTTTAAVTRDAEILSIPNGSWFDSTKGTFFSESFFINTSAGGCCGRIVAGTGVTQYLGSSGGNVIETFNGSGFSTAISPVMTQSVSGKGSMSWSQTTLTRKLSANSNPPSSNIYTGDYISTSIYIGIASNGSLSTNAPIKKVRYYPIDLSDAQLQLLTQ